jgi:hypothetical protein
MDNWRQEFKGQGVSKQLFPSLHELKISEGYYRVHIDDVTKELINAGIVVKTHPEDFDSKENIARHLGESIDSLAKNQHIIIPHSFFDSFVYGNSDTQLRMTEVLLPVRFNESFPSLDSAMMLEKRISEVRLGEIFVGYDIQGVKYTDKEFKVSQIMDSIRATKLRNIMKSLGKIKENDTWGSKPNERGYSASIQAIPSIDDRGVYKVSFKNISPYLTTSLNDMFSPVALSYDLHTEHICPRRSWDFEDYRTMFMNRDIMREGTEVQCCHHIVYGFLLAKETLDKRKEVLSIINPFYAPQSSDFRFFDMMRKNTLIEYAPGELSKIVGDDEHGEEITHIKRLPPNLNEMEMLWWTVKGYHNNIVQKK